MSSSTLNIGGFTPFTTIDFPGKLSCVIFCQGCVWNCSYCYNQHLRSFDQKTEILWKDILNHLYKRKGLLDGVVFSGGEPLCQKGIKETLLEVKDMGYKIALHTSGSMPSILENVLPEVDWIGFDVKAPFNLYDSLTNSVKSSINACKSLALIISSGKDFEVRTTAYPNMLSKDIILNLALYLSKIGVQNYALQEYKSPWNANQPLREEINQFFTDKNFLETMSGLFKNFQVRRCSYC